MITTKSLALCQAFFLPKSKFQTLQNTEWKIILTFAQT